MELTIEQKELIFNWMKTKPYFQEAINQKGVDVVLTEYLKDKSWNRLKHILFYLERRFENKRLNRTYINGTLNI